MRRHLLIYGAQGTGKTLLCRTITTHSANLMDLKRPFSEDLFYGGPVVFEDVTSTELEKCQGYLKTLTTEDTVICERKGRDPIQITAPKVIITTSDSSVRDLVVSSGVFNYVHLEKVT